MIGIDREADPSRCDASTGLRKKWHALSLVLDSVASKGAKTVTALVGSASTAEHAWVIARSEWRGGGVDDEDDLAPSEAPDVLYSGASQCI